MRFELLLAAFALVVAMNVFGLVSARGHRSPLHSLAFFSGLAGLLAVPFVVFGFVALAAHGVTFQVAGAVAVLCGLVSSGAAFAARRRRASGGAV